MELSQTQPNLLMKDFSLVLHDTSRFLARHNILKTPEIAPKNVELLLQMDPAEVTETISRARKILDVHLEIEKEGWDFDDSVRLARAALSTLRLLVSDEIYRLIRRSDIVEIYNQDHIQVFRSFNFFRICNYNLDDVLLNKWYVLYERSPVITQTIMEQVEGHQKGTRCISDFEVPVHPMKEKYAEPQGVFLTKFKYLATVYSGPEQRAGFLTTLRGRRIQMAPGRLAFISN